MVTFKALSFKKAKKLGETKSQKNPVQKHLSVKRLIKLSKEY